MHLPTALYGFTYEYTNIAITYSDMTGLRRVCNNIKYFDLDRQNILLPGVSLIDGKLHKDSSKPCKVVSTAGYRFSPCAITTIFNATEQKQPP
jgi:hypothetical protein